jgi:EmrB/QacA subfamily drug resistance transporter
MFDKDRNAAIRGIGDAGELPQIGKWLPLFLAVAQFMEQMDSSIVATALPAIANDLNASAIDLKLALTSYLVAVACFIPISGWAADRFGACKVFRCAIVVFITGSFMCASADSVTEFVAWRFVQGAGGALMAPVSRLILIQLSPQNQLVAALSWLTIPALFGPLLGPPIGGFLTTFVSWEWIFLINVPIGIIAVLLAPWIIPSYSVSVRRLDGIGLVLSSVCFAGVIFGFSVISFPAIPKFYGVICVSLGIASGWLYVVHARNSDSPLLDLNLFSIPSFRAAIGAGAIFRLGLGVLTFSLPLMFQLVFGMTAFQSGLATLIGAIGSVLGKYAVQFTLRRFGYKVLLLATSILTAVSIALFGFATPLTPFLLIGIFLFANGFLRANFLTAITSFAYADLEKKSSAPATTLSTAGQQISVALGVVLAGYLLQFYSGNAREALVLEDFHFTFVVTSILTSMAAFWFFSLAGTTGQSMSGHGLGKGSKA